MRVRLICAFENPYGVSHTGGKDKKGAGDDFARSLFVHGGGQV